MSDRAMICGLGAVVAIDRFSRLLLGPGNDKGRMPFLIDESQRTPAEEMWFALMAEATQDRPPLAQCIERGWMFRDPEEET